MRAKTRNLLLLFAIVTGVFTACLGLETQHTNHLGWALLFSSTVFTVIGCLYLSAQSLASSEASQPSDRGLWLPCIGALIISLVTPLEYLFLPPFLPRSDHNQDIGLIMCAGGLAFYLYALRDTEARRLPSLRIPNIPHFIITAWQMILCPISASLLLFVLGLGIGFSSWVGLLMLVVLVLPGLIHWIRTIDAPSQQPV